MCVNSLLFSRSLKGQKEEQSLADDQKAKGIVLIKIIRDGRPDDENKTANKETHPLSNLVSFDKLFRIRLSIGVGEVYLAQFPYRIGSELAGDHYVVSVANSKPKNPTVLVVPLKSYKNNKLNPNNAVMLGNIPGLSNGKKSVALINQIRSIDKIRLLSRDDIGMTLEKNESQKPKFNEVVCTISKTVYRLTDEQLENLLNACKGFVNRNMRKRTKDKLVDF